MFESEGIEQLVRSQHGMVLADKYLVDALLAAHQSTMCKCLDELIYRGAESGI